MRDHPRMRGEDRKVRLFQQLNQGSPPHARGRRVGGVGEGRLRVDHPRMRGEDIQQIILGFDALGSPPHARGRHHVSLGGLGVRRITPACAGKTRRVRGRVRHVPDHPRMRGEDISPDGSSPILSGSPPHARGRPCSRPHSTDQSGITPACAGKTLL